MRSYLKLVFVFLITRTLLSSAIEPEKVSSSLETCVGQLSKVPSPESAVLKNPLDLLREVHRDSGEYVYLMRGVAPGEAEGRGRIAGRELYGIQGKVTPGYVMNRTPEFPIASPPTLYKIYADMKFYADQGAALEMARNHGEIISPFDASRRYPQARGYIIVYRVSKDAVLEKHPESNASVSRRVVAIPSNVEVFGILSSPTNINEVTGLPDYNEPLTEKQ
jgi:hypothetical protein